MCSIVWIGSYTCQGQGQYAPGSRPSHGKWNRAWIAEGTGIDAKLDDAGAISSCTARVESW